MQFKQLSAVEQCILRSAAVAGEHFSVWTIATAAEIEPGNIEDVCQSLSERLQFIKGRWKSRTRKRSDLCTLYHSALSLSRSSVSAASRGPRSKLHLILAQRLKAFCDPCEQELAAELALHFEGGYEYEQAIRYLMISANNAAGRLAYRDSIEILRHGVGLVSRLGPALQAPSWRFRFLS